MNQVVMSSQSSRESTMEDDTIASLTQLLKERRRVMILLRGLPGSGKSYLAKRINGHCGGYIASADNYFMRSGVYKFDPDHLEYAHVECQHKVKDKAREGVSPIIVDNTNLECWEMRPYVITALQFDYIIHLQEPLTSWKDNPRFCHRYNRHDIPLEKIIRMKDKFDRRLTAVRLIEMYTDRSVDLTYYRSQVPLSNGSSDNVDSRPVKAKSPLEPAPPSIRSAIRSYSSHTDWQVPFYPSSETNSLHPSASSTNSTNVCDSSCQTVPASTSSASPYVSDFGETGLCPRDVSRRRVLTLDKSTSINVNASSSRDEQLQILSEKFPEVEFETLLDIIEVCNGNIHYAINVLSDCDSNNSDDSMPMLDDLPSESVEVPSLAPVMRQFSIEIPAGFALELEEEFGEVPANCFFNRRLCIPKHLARQIHELWLQQCQPLAEEAAPVLKPPTGELEEQMQLEEALKRSRAYVDSPSNPELDELYSKYPGCAEEILDQIYFENDRDLQRTITAVDEQTRLASNSTGVDNNWSKVAQKPPPVEADAYQVSGTGDYLILEDSEYSELRDELLERRKRLFDQKMRNKDPKTAQYYSEEINKINREYQQLLNALISFRRPTFASTTTLDLHGSKIKEGAQLFKAFVAAKQAEINEKGMPRIDLEIITGWGFHSPKMKGQLLPAMLQLASQLNLKIITKSKGSFTIRLNRTC